MLTCVMHSISFLFVLEGEVMESTKTSTDSKSLGNTTKDYEFKMPKNLRQIGNISGVSKVIYVEDYVMSYIKQLSQKEQSECKIAILLGKSIYTEDVKNLFIKGAIEMANIDINESDVFTDESWTDVYVRIKECFSDVEIVGWAIIGLGIVLDLGSKVELLHKENFADKDTILLKFDSMEKEEGFYIIEDNQLTRQKGYYIYYEKNIEMQNYMIDYNNTHQEKIHEEYEDVATKKIRNIIDEKNNKKIEKNTRRLTYATGTLLAVIILMVASTMLRNYHQMKNLETALYSLTENLGISDNIKGDKEGLSNTLELAENETKGNSSETSGEQLNSSNIEEQSPDESGTVDVETVPGEVAQIEEPTKDPIKEPTSASEGESGVQTPTQTEPQNQEVVSAVNEVKYYIVRQGDSLASICGELYSDASQKKIDEIIKLNKIEDQNKIFAGQQLIVP